MSEKAFPRSSSGISSDISQASTSGSSTLLHEDSISLSSIKGPYQITEEIKQGAASFLGKICLHPEECRLTAGMVPQLYSALDWKYKLRHLRQEAAIDSAMAKIHLQCSNVFKRRLKDIEMNAPFDSEAKLRIYQDWVFVLIKFNENIFEDIARLENILSDLRRATQAYPYLSNSRRDLSTLMKLISYPFYQRKWSVTGIEFKTLQLAEVMGLNETNNCDKKVLHKLKRDGLSISRVGHSNKYI